MECRWGSRCRCRLCDFTLPFIESMTSHTRLRTVVAKAVAPKDLDRPLHGLNFQIEFKYELRNTSVEIDILYTKLNVQNIKNV